MIRRWFGRKGNSRLPQGGDGDAASAAEGEGAVERSLDLPTRDRLALDLLTRDWQCACCGEWHYGIMDISCKAPDPWPHPRDYAPNGALRLDGDFLTADFCVLGGEDFFVRSVLEIPVRGLDGNWGFGCWNSLSRANFDSYVERFDEGFPADQGPWFGWLANSVRIYSVDAEPIAVDVFPQAGRQRPRIVVQNAAHPLARAQRDGISAGDLLDLMMAYGHGPTAQ